MPLFPPGIPSGCCLSYAGSTVPGGWLTCDGSAISRTTYAALFGAIGTTWGSGDGSTTFNLPDLRGRVAVGVDTGGVNLPAGKPALAGTGGEEQHTLTTSEMPSHTHTVNVANAASNVGNNFSCGGINSPTGTVTSSSAGSGSAHNNLQPYAALYWIIKT